MATAGGEFDFALTDEKSKTRTIRKILSQDPQVFKKRFQLAEELGIDLNPIETLVKQNGQNVTETILKLIDNWIAMGSKVATFKNLQTNLKEIGLVDTAEKLEDAVRGGRVDESASSVASTVQDVKIASIKVDNEGDMRKCNIKIGDKITAWDVAKPIEGKKWESLAKSLKLGDNAIEEIRRSDDDLRIKVELVIRKWRQGAPSECTIGNLCAILIDELDDREAADKIYKMAMK